jgi:hypothetical protein
MVAGVEVAAEAGEASWAKGEVAEAALLVESVGEGRLCGVVVAREVVGVRAS